MSMTDAEKLRHIAGYGFMSDEDCIELGEIAARLEQLGRENAELKPPALGPNPSVAEIVRDYLKRNGYGGLWYDGMGSENEADISEYMHVWNAGYIQPDGTIGPERKE